MRKAIGFAVALALVLPACSNRADSQECKDWQADYIRATILLNVLPADQAVALGNRLETRPDGCLIPPPISVAGSSARPSPGELTAFQVDEETCAQLGGEFVASATA